MKKLFLIITTVFATAISSFAKDEKIPVVINKDEQTSSKNTWDRAPMRIFVEVYYDSDAGILEVVGDETIEAEVFLYNASGVMENYSSSLNAIFPIYSSGEYTILIQGDGWYGEGLLTI